MRAAWYERQGPAGDVLVVGEMPDPAPGRGEVRMKVAASGINPGDVKKRRDEYGYGMPYRRVIPHSDGAGVIDQVGEGIPAARIGELVWCFGAQSYRPFGTAADYCILPAAQAVPLPRGVPFEQGACLGIPGITARCTWQGPSPAAGSSCRARLAPWASAPSVSRQRLTRRSSASSAAPMTLPSHGAPVRNTSCCYMTTRTKRYGGWHPMVSGTSSK